MVVLEDMEDEFELLAQPELYDLGNPLTSNAHSLRCTPQCIMPHM